MKRIEPDRSSVGPREGAESSPSGDDGVRPGPGARRVTWAPRRVAPVHEYDGVFFYPGGQMVITNPNLKHLVVVVEKETPERGDEIVMDYRC